MPDDDERTDPGLRRAREASDVVLEARVTALEARVEAIGVTAGTAIGKVEHMDRTLSSLAQDIGQIKGAVLETPARRVLDALLRNTATTVAAIAAATVIVLVALVLAAGLDPKSLTYSSTPDGGVSLGVKGGADADDDGGTTAPDTGYGMGGGFSAAPEPSL